MGFSASKTRVWPHSPAQTRPPTKFKGKPPPPQLRFSSSEGLQPRLPPARVPLQLLAVVQQCLQVGEAERSVEAVAVGPGLPDVGVLFVEVLQKSSPG